VTYPSLVFAGAGEVLTVGRLHLKVERSRFAAGLADWEQLHRVRSAVMEERCTAAAAHRAEEDAIVLASGKVASSPSSPSSAHAVPAYAEHGCGWLRRSLALRSARWPRVRAGDGQTDASGGGSGLRMGTSEGRSQALPSEAMWWSP
jgi:hypothetical protein